MADPILRYINLPRSEPPPSVDAGRVLIKLPVAVTAAMLSRVPCSCNRYRAINLTTLFVYCTVTVRGRAASPLPAGSRYREKGSGHAGIGILLDDSVRAASGAAGGAVEESGM